MDPIQAINIKKDSTFAMLLEAQRRGHELYYMEQTGLFIANSEARSLVQRLSVADNPQGWFDLDEGAEAPLAGLDVILMRKDPPFDMDYIYATYVLDLAERDGALVVNKPQSLRDANEKLFTSWFPQCCAPALVTRDYGKIRAFIATHGRSVIKPLDGMGGDSVFQLRPDDPNLNVIMESVSSNGRELVMVQKYIEEITSGDKRILLINGEPIEYALARVPGEGDFRGNLAKGGVGVGVSLTERDLWISAQVGPELKRRGILFAGLDVIGEYLTEINVTSPTCIRELDKLYKMNISAGLFDVIEAAVAEAP